MHSRTKRQLARGFTLLELMVVIVIIGILGGVLTLNLVGAQDRAKQGATVSSMKQVKAALIMYHGKYSEYPATAVGLDALLMENFFNSELKDSWGTPFEYYSPGHVAEYELISAGSDKTFDTEDDIISYPEDN